MLKDISCFIEIFRRLSQLCLWLMSMQVKMRSRTSDMEGPENGPLKQLTRIHNVEKEGSKQELMRKKTKAQEEKESSEEKVVVCGTLKKPQKPREMQLRRAGLMDLTKEDLVHLLGVMEGEVQVKYDCVMPFFVCLP